MRLWVAAAVAAQALARYAAARELAATRGYCRRRMEAARP